MVEKAVIPVAGLGTRMLPASKSIPKEMLPVVDRPAIAYVVEEAVKAGIREIILVTSTGKSAIEDYFDRAPELEKTLEQKGKDRLLAQLREIIPAHVRVVSVRQGEPLGLGHAIHCAGALVGEAPFAVLLPDVLIDAGDGETDLARMVELFRDSGKAQIMVEPVAREQVQQYGIADIAGQAPERGGAVDLRGLVEKPAPERAPSSLSVVGRYVLPASVMPLLARTPPGAGGEIQLTDAIDGLVARDGAQAYAMTGKTFDCGSKAGYLQAFFHFALRHPDTADTARKIVRDLAESGDAD